MWGEQLFLGLLVFGVVTAIVLWIVFSGRPSKRRRVRGRSAGLDPCISYNFNGTSIPAGSFIWFSSIVKVKSPSPPPAGTTLTITGQTISDPTSTIDTTVPDAVLTFEGGCGSGAVTFSGGSWQTTASVGFGDNIFVSGVLVPVTTAIPGGLKNVQWCATFTSPTVTNVCWQWAAAVYSPNTIMAATDYNGMMVKPLHSTSCDAYHNGDQAGTPEATKAFVIGGAGGGGGSNYTGSLSSTLCFAPRAGCVEGQSFCGNSCCPDGQCCLGSQCCTSAQTCCVDGCTDTNFDYFNCGACSTQCNLATQGCFQGMCLPCTQTPLGTSTGACQSTVVCTGSAATYALNSCNLTSFNGCCTEQIGTLTIANNCAGDKLQLTFETLSPSQSLILVVFSIFGDGTAGCSSNTSCVVDVPRCSTRSKTYCVDLTALGGTLASASSLSFSAGISVGSVVHGVCTPSTTGQISTGTQIPFNFENCAQLCSPQYYETFTKTLCAC